MPYSPPRHNAHRAKANKAASDAEYNAHRRQNNAFYKSMPWVRLRRIALKMEPLCVHCKILGYINMADMVDHIIPITEGGARLSLSNLQPLCNYHHGVKSGKERAAKASMRSKR